LDLLFFKVLLEFLKSALEVVKGAEGVVCACLVLVLIVVPHLLFLFLQVFFESGDLGLDLLVLALDGGIEFFFHKFSFLEEFSPLFLLLFDFL